MPTINILVGDARARLAQIPDASVHCVVTSPPYWGLRDYGTAQWEGGDPDCKHTGIRRLNRPGSKDASSGGLERTRDRVSRDCVRCGASRVDRQLGLEATFDRYIEELVAILRDVRRVLRPDGTLWLNLGDCYATGGGKAKAAGGSGPLGRNWEQCYPGADAASYCGDHGADPKRGPARPQVPDSKHPNAGVPTCQPNRMPQPGLKPKDLVLLPARVALALQADGWWLRSEIVWHKPNAMPESVRDRPTSAHEKIFLLSPSETYFYDEVAVAEPAITKAANGNKARKVDAEFGRPADHLGRGAPWQPSATRRRRNVWSLITRPFRAAHFATFPPELPELCIQAGTSDRGVCPTCAAPWQRIVAKTDKTPRQRAQEQGWTAKADGKGLPRQGLDYAGGHNNPQRVTRTLGWQATCECHGHFEEIAIPRDGDEGLGEPETLRVYYSDPGAPVPVPATVLDPFGGAGTTALVAARLGRDAAIIELNPEYAALAGERIAGEGHVVRVTPARAGRRRSDSDRVTPLRKAA